MRSRKPLRTPKTDGRPAKADAPVRHVLRLYVAGATERSRRAILQARHLCETELAGNCDLEVIDVYQQPILAREGQIVATPTLVRVFPRPVRRLIGNLANTPVLLAALDLDAGTGERP